MEKRRKKKENMLEGFFKRWKKEDIIVKQNKVTIFYDVNLEKITGVPFEETMMPNGFTFADSLHSLFVSYPEVPKKIPPGKLGFLVNGKRPETFDLLKNGDRIEFVVMEERFIPGKEQILTIQKEIENKILRFIERHKIDISFEKIKEAIFNGKNVKDLYSVIDVFSEKIEDPNEGNEALSVLTKAWDYFPHKFLRGSCPVEKISELEKDNPYFKLNKE